MDKQKLNKILKAVGTVLIALGVALGGSMALSSCGPTKLTTQKYVVSDSHDSTIVVYSTQNKQYGK